MAGKKTSIPGVDALFSPGARAVVDDARRPEDPKAGIHESPQARMREDVRSVIPERPQAPQPECPPSRMPAGGPAGTRASEEDIREKFTFRFDASTLLMLERVWAELRGRTGRRIRKSWIVEAALKHVIRDPEVALRVLIEEMRRVATA